MKNFFHKLAVKISNLSGSPSAFFVALTVVLSWAVTGPLFNFSNTWQLVINTFTTISTFLMVFLLQNSQNRDTKAIQLKLDELIKAVRGARNELVDLEDFTDEELEKLSQEFKRVRETALSKKRYQERKKDNPEI